MSLQIERPMEQGLKVIKEQQDVDVDDCSSGESAGGSQESEQAPALKKPASDQRVMLSRCIVIIALLVSAAVVASLTFLLMTHDEKNDFEHNVGFREFDCV